jgi:hypothetical protein
MERLAKLRPRRRRRRRHLGLDSPEAQRMRTAMNLNETVTEMYAMQMRRRHPEATEEEIETLVKAWRLATPRQQRREEGQR